MHKVSFLFFLLVFLSSPFCSAESNRAGCPISSEQVEQLQIKINDLQTSLMYLRAIWTTQAKNSKTLTISLLEYGENLQKKLKNLSALLSQATISLNKAKDDLTNLKQDYETLKQLYEAKMNEDLRDKIIIGVVAALVGCGIGVIVW